MLNNNSVVLEEFSSDGIWEATTIEINPDDFAIDDQALEADMCSVGKKLFFYGNLAGLLHAQAARKKSELESIYSQLALQFRTTLDKPTESKVEENVLTHVDYVEAQKTYIESEQDSRRVDNLFKSMSKVADVIISLSYRQGKEIQKMGGSFGD